MPIFRVQSGKNYTGHRLWCLWLISGMCVWVGGYLQNKNNCCNLTRKYKIFTAYCRKTRRVVGCVKCPQSINVYSPIYRTRQAFRLDRRVVSWTPQAFCQGDATPRPSPSPSPPLTRGRGSQSGQKPSPKVKVRRLMSMTKSNRCQPIVTMTPTSFCSYSHGIVQPSWRDPRHFRQSLANWPCVLEELSLPKALKKEVERGVVAEVVGRRVGMEVGRPGWGCQVALAILTAFPQTWPGDALMRAKGREGGGEDVAGGDGIADVVHWLLLEQEWPGVGRPLFFQKFIHFAKVTTIVTKMFTKFTTKIGDSWNLSLFLAQNMSLNLVICFISHKYWYKISHKI